MEQTAKPGATAPFPANPIVPTTLAFIAGFVDACTFLAFAGFFVAQATGSFVVAGSQIVNDNAGFGFKVLAIPVFILAGMLTTCVVRVAGDNSRGALAGALCLEAVLLAGLAFAGIIGSSSELAAAPALFGLGAMGVQSAAVRLLLSNSVSTNVMTTNTTQFAIEMTDSILKTRLSPRLVSTGLVMLGFLVGVMVGSIAFSMLGLSAVALPVALVLSVAIVAAWPAPADMPT